LIQPTSSEIPLNYVVTAARTNFDPGQVNLRRAQIVVVNKAATAGSKTVAAIRENVRRTNPKARIALTSSEVQVDRPEMISGKKVLVAEVASR